MHCMGLGVRLKEREAEESQNNEVRERLRHPPSLALKTEGARSHRMRAVSGNWKSQETDFPLEHLGEHSIADTLILDH